MSDYASENHKPATSESVEITLAEYKELAEYQNGRISTHRKTFNLDLRDEDDADLIELFRQAGLPPTPANWRNLLEIFAYYHVPQEGRPKAADDINLIQKAFEEALKLTKSSGSDPSLPAVCESLVRGPVSFRRPHNGHHMSQGQLHPKTLKNRLAKALSHWEDSARLPHTVRNYEFAPHIFEELSGMVRYLRNLSLV